MQNKSCLSGRLDEKAFTLIELLVVVLIIGILAAVALPQYKVAVAKARMTQLITLANSVAQAEERYYLANGQYTTDFSELDIELVGSITGNASVRVLKNPAGWSIHLNAYTSGGRWESVDVFDSRLPTGTHLLYSFNHGSLGSLQNKRFCYAARNNTLGNLLCKNATNRTSPSGSPTGEYSYQF